MSTKISNYLKMVNLHEFLSLTKKIAPTLESLMCVHIVLGNESCDLDSMVSTLALALYYKNTKYRYSEIKAVPILNCKANEFELKTLNNYVLDKYQVDKNNLIFKDEVNWAALTGKEMLKLTLVDHHVLSESNSYLKASVREIIDHRPWDKNAQWDKDVVITNELVGSCATLIARAVSSNYSQCACTAAQLLYETIVFDTIGFRPEAKKATPLDDEIATKLEKVLHITPNRDALFNELWTAHNDVSNLTSKQLLIKDLKTLPSVCIPGLPMLAEEYLLRPDAVRTIFDFGQEHKSVVVLMGIEAQENGVKRDLAVCGQKSSTFTAILQCLLAHDELQLEEVDKNLPNIKYFKLNQYSSRKVVLPILRECVNILSAASSDHPVLQSISD